jgi:ribosomal protein S6
MLIIRPTVKSEGLDRLKENIEKIIGDGEGKILEAIDLGIRRLEYNISGHQEARYFVYYFDGKGSIVNEIANFINLSDDVLRQLTIQAEGKVPSPSLENLRDSGSILDREEHKEESESKEDKGEVEEKKEEEKK